MGEEVGYSRCWRFVFKAGLGDYNRFRFWVRFGAGNRQLRCACVCVW